MLVLHRGRRRHGEVPGPAAHHVHHTGSTGRSFRPGQHPAGSAGAQVSALLHNGPLYQMCVLLFQNVKTTNADYITVCSSERWKDRGTLLHL